MIPPHGYTIFCDDIRDEVGGKTSMMGIYTTVLYVNGDFPVLLPRFGIATFFRQSMEWPNRNPLGLRIYLPGDVEDSPSISGEMPISDPKELVFAANERPSDSEQLLVSGTRILLSPLLLKMPGFIRVRASRDDERYQLGSLSVERITQPT